MPITVVAWFKAWTVFALSNAEALGSNLKRRMYVCVSVLSGCVVLCVDRGLVTG
jgi:hypothetical protein